jgi:hypothetical protein
MACPLRRYQYFQYPFFPFQQHLLADRILQVAETKKRVNGYSFRSNIGISLGIINQDVDLMNNYLSERTGFSSPQLAPSLRGVASLS